MAAIVGVDAKITLSTDGTTYNILTERNEFSISIKVDTAEHKVFVADFPSAWVTKQRTWMSWSGSLSGYFDTADDTIFNGVVAGQVVWLRFYDSRNAVSSPKMWYGQAVLTSVEHKAGTSDYATLTVSFEGCGSLTHITAV